MQAAARYFQMGGSPTSITLSENPREPDWLDAAGPLGAEVTAGYLLQFASSDAVMAVRMARRAEAAPV